MLEGASLNYFNLRKVVVLSFMIFLSVILFSSLFGFQNKTRDTVRKANFFSLMKALDLYHDKHGFYPDSTDDQNGWDLSYAKNGSEASFLPILAAEGFIDHEIFDPINDDSYFFRYKKFPADSFGCSKSFYILQIVNFETKTGDIGMGKCKEADWTRIAPYGYTMQGYD